MQSGDQFESGIRVLGWPSVWAIAAAGLIIAMIGGQSPTRLDESGYALLGAATGCLISSWTITGTWIGLTPKPTWHTNRSSRVAKQLAVAAPCLIGAFAIIVVSWPQDETIEKSFITYLLLTWAITLTGPMIAWQWTRRQMHRGEIHPHRSQSIRQILGIVLTIALAIGAVRMCQRWFGTTVAETAVTVSIALNWTLLLVAILGRRPWLVLIFVGLLIAEWIGISTMFDLQTQKNDRELTFLGAMLHCSFGFSLLFLLQIRASGYRWLDAPVPTRPDAYH